MNHQTKHTIKPYSIKITHYAGSIIKGTFTFTPPRGVKMMDIQHSWMLYLFQSKGDGTIPWMIDGTLLSSNYLMRDRPVRKDVMSNHVVANWSVNIAKMPNTCISSVIAVVVAAKDRDDLLKYIIETADTFGDDDEIYILHKQIPSRFNYITACHLYEGSPNREAEPMSRAALTRLFKQPSVVDPTDDLQEYYKGCVFTPAGNKQLLKGDPGSALCKRCPYMKSQHSVFVVASAPENSIMTSLLGPKPNQPSFNHHPYEPREKDCDMSVVVMKPKKKNRPVVIQEVNIFTVRGDKVTGNVKMRIPDDNTKDIDELFLVYVFECSLRRGIGDRVIDGALLDRRFIKQGPPRISVGARIRKCTWSATIAKMPSFSCCSVLAIVIPAEKEREFLEFFIKHSTHMRGVYNLHRQLPSYLKSQSTSKVHSGGEITRIAEASDRHISDVLGSYIDENDVHPVKEDFEMAPVSPPAIKKAKKSVRIEAISITRGYGLMKNNPVVSGEVVIYPPRRMKRGVMHESINVYVFQSPIESGYGNYIIDGAMFDRKFVQQGPIQWTIGDKKAVCPFSISIANMKGFKTKSVVAVVIPAEKSDEFFKFVVENSTYSHYGCGTYNLQCIIPSRFNYEIDAYPHNGTSNRNPIPLDDGELHDRIRDQAINNRKVQLEPNVNYHWGIQPSNYYGASATPSRKKPEKQDVVMEPEDWIENIRKVKTTLPDETDPTCSICLTNKSNCFFIPCGHICCCTECCVILKEGTLNHPKKPEDPTKCPQCQVLITSVMVAHVS